MCASGSCAQAAVDQGMECFGFDLTRRIADQVGPGDTEGVGEQQAGLEAGIVYRVS